MKKVEAWPQEKDGAGYAVKYEDGYVSWSPKEVFEKAYFPIGDDASNELVTDEMVDHFVLSHRFETVVDETFKPKMTVCLLTLRNGVVLGHSTPCTGPEKTQDDAETCLRLAKERVRQLLSFVLKWSKNGLAS